MRTFAEVPANPVEIRRAHRRAVRQAVALFLAAGATLRAVALAPPGRATVAIAVHRIGLVPLSGVSAPYHRWGVGTVSRR